MSADSNAVIIAAAISVGGLVFSKGYDVWRNSRKDQEKKDQDLRLIESKAYARASDIDQEVIGRLEGEVRRLSTALESERAISAQRRAEDHKLIIQLSVRISTLEGTLRDNGITPP